MNVIMDNNRPLLESLGEVPGSNLENGTKDVEEMKQDDFESEKRVIEKCVAE